MDFERIYIVLQVFHQCRDMPGLENIRAAALEELREHANSPVSAGALEAQEDKDDSDS